MYALSNDKSAMNSFAVSVLIWHVANYSVNLDPIMLFQAVAGNTESRLIVDDNAVEFGDTRSCQRYSTVSSKTNEMLTNDKPGK